MLERYSLPEMSNIWTERARFDRMLVVEKLVAFHQGELGIIPKEAANKIQSMTISLDRIKELELKVKHETNAFIDAASETIPSEYSRWIHFGLTSSDILDTTQAMLIAKAKTILFKEIDELTSICMDIFKENLDTYCIGRTHGMHAEPITFGSKFGKYFGEISRNRYRIRSAIINLCKVKISGPTGNYTTTSKEIEHKVSQSLQMQPCHGATQVSPRDNHAELISALALYGTGLERIALEIRHLSRPEIDEVSEGFSAEQKGSSAMPHKKNPIDSENISGLARMLRSYVQPAMENILLWHERDMSHSSVERIILPDAFILAHYMTVKMTNILTNLVIKPENMQKNILLTKDQTSSALELMSLIKNQGLTREEAYRHLQKKHGEKNG